ncbi:hypothetical protein LguiA_029265 [Lonicera macranthoides]
MPESLRNENVVMQQLSDDELTMEEAVREKESEREYKTTDITLSCLDLTKHFGKKLDDAAQILIYNEAGMQTDKKDEWALLKRKKVNALCVCSGNKGIKGTHKGDPSCSNPPPMPAGAGISHKKSNSRQEKDVGTVTIKAKHGDVTIRFQLPFL